MTAAAAPQYDVKGVQRDPLVQAFHEFLDRYSEDPVAFVREQLGAEPDPFQRELLEAVGRGERRISVRSGHGVGKTTALAWVIIWHLTCRYPQKTVCTAPTQGQLFDALASEVKAWIGRLSPELQALFEVKSDRIELRAAPSESFVAFKTSRAETPEALAGVHSEHVLLIGDEASGIPDPVFEAAAGSMSGHSAVTILAGNPVRTSGLFFDSHHRLKGEWYTIHVSCVTSPRVSDDFVREMARRYGERSNAFRVRVLGEFPLADADTVISYELAEAATKREVKPTLVRPLWGLDCARYGDDRSALAKRRGNVLMEPVKTWHGLGTMELAGRVKAIWDETPADDRPEEILVDVIGIGAGVCDRLRELGLPARGINVSESPAMRDKFRNLRAELWWRVREWFETQAVYIGEETPVDSNDSTLLAELTAVKYTFTSSGKIAIEGKKELKKRGLPSPDKADAFVLTFAAEAASAIHGSSGSSNWAQPLRRLIRGIV